MDDDSKIGTELNSNETSPKLAEYERIKVKDELKQKPSIDKPP